MSYGNLIPSSHFVLPTHLPSEIHLQKIMVEDKKQILRLSDKMQIQRLFSASREYELIIVTSNSVLKYDLKGNKVLGQAEL